MIEVCGFKDSKGRFHDTREQVRNAEQVYSELELKNKVYNQLSAALDHRSSYIEIRVLAEKFTNTPELFLPILWESIRIKFKRQW
mgnify:CR=1 FL=1